MSQRRSIGNVRQLCTGPGRLIQALAIDIGVNGASLDEPPFDLRKPAASAQFVEGHRIGIALGTETLWRFELAGSPYLSRAFPILDGGASGWRVDDR
jgi:DNA-3-methyladenine glycosylase